MADSESAPFFLLRVESREGRFLAGHARDLQGVVLHGRHLAPYPKDSERAKEGLRGDELAQQVRVLGVPHVQDPNTALLPWVLSGRATRRYPRAELMRCARRLDPNFGPGDFDSDEALHDLVLDTLAPQRGVMNPAPPSFCFSKLDDPWLDVNVRAAAETQRLTRGAALALFVQGDLVALRSGSLAHAAVRYAEYLTSGGLAFLAVPGLEPENAEPGDLDAYLRCIEAWTAAGFRVIADCVGRFGVAAVAAGAAGMCCGLRSYRTTPDLSETRHSRSGALRWWAPVRGDRIKIEDARRRSAKGKLPACPVEDCGALAEGAKLDELRLHNIHLTLAELLEAAGDPQALQRRLSESPIVYVRAWGQALATQLARRRTA
jgi:hypothetical protein